MFHDRRINTENVIHLYMDYYSAMMNEDILSFADKWMELGNILSEVTQTQKEHKWYVLANKWILAKKVQNTQDTVHRTQKGQQAEVPK